jgi:hypothetical protein
LNDPVTLDRKPNEREFTLARRVPHDLNHDCRLARRLAVRPPPKMRSIFGGEKRAPPCRYSAPVANLALPGGCLADLGQRPSRTQAPFHLVLVLL